MEKRNRTAEKKNGITKGEKNEKIKIAKELLKLKMPIEQIIQITKLPKEEIASEYIEYHYIELPKEKVVKNKRPQNNSEVLLEGSRSNIL